jgi:structural maintenance of chromosome 1
MDASINQLQATIAHAEDAAFADFCRRVGLGNIRGYEGNQLKAMQELAEKRLQFSSQISRLENEYDMIWL